MLLAFAQNICWIQQMLQDITKHDGIELLRRIFRKERLDGSGVDKVQKMAGVLGGIRIGLNPPHVMPMICHGSAKVARSAAHLQDFQSPSSRMTVYLVKCQRMRIILVGEVNLGVVFHDF